MLDDDDDSTRIKAVNVIKEIRRTSQMSEMSKRPVRQFRVPTLLYDATCYHDMINWKTEKLTEPPMTYLLTDAELEDIKDNPLTAPPYLAHTQSIERAIKTVTNALAGARHGYIKAQIHSRRMYSKNDSKTKLVQMLNQNQV